MFCYWGLLPGWRVARCHEPPFPPTGFSFRRTAGSGQSFWYFDEDHPVRVWVYDRLCHKYYDYAMLVIIGACGGVVGV